MIVNKASDIFALVVVVGFLCLFLVLIRFLMGY